MTIPPHKRERFCHEPVNFNTLCQIPCRDNKKSIIYSDLLNNQCDIIYLKR